MAIDEQDRHRLHQRLDDVLGADEAATLMSHLPPVGWLDVTTNHDLAAVGARMDARFEAVDYRFDALIGQFDAKFDTMDNRFEALIRRFDAKFETMDNRFEALIGRLDARFEAVDHRFDALIGRFDAKFDTVDAKLDGVRHEFGEQLALGLRDQLRVLVFTFVACMLTFASVVIAAVKL